MKKILLSLAFVLVYFMPATAADRAIGITLSAAQIDTDLTDDVDSNGSVDTTKSISNDVFYGSIFLEATKGPMTFGIDIIPMAAEFDTRSTTQTSTKAKADGAAPQVSGTNKATADVSKHVTLYLQPQFETPGGLTVFGTLGYVTADVEIDYQSVSSINKIVNESLDGVKVGVGVKRDMGDRFMKFELARTDYDDISLTTGNNTKVTADLDNTQLNLSIGKKF